MKRVALVAAIVLGSAIFSAIPFFMLSSACSTSRPLQTQHAQEGAANNGSKGADSRQEYSQPNQDTPARAVPALYFEEPPTQAEKPPQPGNSGGNKPRDWGDTFWCEVKVTDVLLALFTLFLVIVGAWQGVQLRASVDALPNIERAYVFLHVIDTAFSQTTADMASHHASKTNAREATVHFKFVNHGRTPATIKKISAGLCHGATFPDKMPEKSLPFAEWEKAIPAGRFLPSATPYSVTDPERLTGMDHDSWMKEEFFFFFYGQITYDDVLGKERVTRFLWRYGKGENFDEWGGKKYNERT